MRTLKGTETSLSYVQCFLYRVSSLMNVSIFCITWLDRILRNGIAGSFGSSIFNFEGSSMLFSIVAALIYIPTNSAHGFLFSTPLSEEILI